MRGTIVTRTLKDSTKRYDVVWRVDGKQKWKTFHRHKDAERFLVDAVKATQEGTYQSVTPTLMSVVFDRWLTHSLSTRVKQGVLKASTAKSYKSMLEKHLRPAFGAIRSDRFRADAATDWARAKADEIDGGKMGHKSYNNTLVLLHSILQWARHPAQGFLVHDPLIGLRLLPVPRVERPFLERPAIASLLTAADNILDRTLLTLAVYSGLRRGAALRLEWADLNWEEGRISVRRSVTPQGIITTPKTARSSRGVDVPASVLACLSTYRESFPPLPGDFIFRDETGTTLGVENWASRIMKRSCDRAGIPPIGLHGLRHTYASLLINQGEHIKYVSQQLGHASIQITADLYGHMFQETSTAAMKRLDERIGVSNQPRGQVVSIATGLSAVEPSNKFLTRQAERGRNEPGPDRKTKA